VRGEGGRPAAAAGGRGGGAGEEFLQRSDAGGALLPGLRGGGTVRGSPRRSPDSVTSPFAANPATTILPSAWIATSLARSPLPKKSVVSEPLVPKLVSTLPSVA